MEVSGKSLSKWENEWLSNATQNFPSHDRPAHSTMLSCRVPNPVLSTIGSQQSLPAAQICEAVRDHVAIHSPWAQLLRSEGLFQLI
ncbi:hypothetical protein AV530_003166 [Patagioenas fasciata monilis]|uniref:Uncharacterized protein n=1 Tax=Patagioenas fasciata monilis TaxID=372326 RepID=A0A1V4KWE0_PATFA|nr:hypothetical protein AV530_003166 [Patagioenas fasciata monilis]